MSTVQSKDTFGPVVGLVLGEYRGATKGGCRERFIATSVPLISSNIKIHEIVCSCEVLLLVESHTKISLKDLKLV